MQNDFTIELKILISKYIINDGIYICNNAGITTLQPENYTSDDLIVLRFGDYFEIYKGDNNFLHITLKKLIAPLLLADLNKLDYYNANTNEIKNAWNKLLELINKNDYKSINLDFTKFDTYDNEKLASYWIKILKELYDSVNFAKRLNLKEEIEFWKYFSKNLAIVDEHKKSKLCADCLVDLEKKGKIILKTTLELYFDTSKYVKLTKIFLDNLKKLNLNIDNLDCLNFFDRTTKNFQYINNFPKIIYKICQNHLENYIIETIKKIKEYIISSKNNIILIFTNLKDLKIAIHNDLFLTFCTHFDKLYEHIEFVDEISKINLETLIIFDVNKLIDDFKNDTKHNVIEFDLYKNEILDLVCIYINNQKSNIELFFKFFYFTKYEFVIKNTIDKRHEELEKIETNLKNFLCVKDDRNDFLIILKYLKEKLDDLFVIFGEFLDNYILAKKLKQFITSKIKSLDLENNLKRFNTEVLDQIAIHIIENQIKINEYINIENVHYDLLYERLKSSIVYFNYILKKVGNNETFEGEINFIVKLLKKIIYCKWKYLINNKTLIKFIETSETTYFKILKFVFYRKNIISKQFESLNDAKCCYNFTNVELSINIDGKDYKIEKNYIVSKIVKKIIHQPINGIKLLKSKHAVKLIDSNFHFTPNLEHILDFFNIFFYEIKDVVYDKNIAIFFEKIIDEYKILSKISYLSINKNTFEFNLNTKNFSMTKIKHETINIIKIIDQMIKYIDAINKLTENNYEYFIFKIQFDDKDFFKCIRNSILQIEQYFAFFEIFLKNNMMPELNFFYFYLKIQKFFKKNIGKKFFLTVDNLILSFKNLPSELKSKNFFNLENNIESKSVCIIEIIKNDKTEIVNTFCNNFKEEYFKIYNLLKINEEFDCKIETFAYAYKFFKTQKNNIKKLGYMKKSVDETDIKNLKEFNQQNLKSTKKTLLILKKFSKILQSKIDDIKSQRITNFLNKNKEILNDYIPKESIVFLDFNNLKKNEMPTFKEFFDKNLFYVHLNQNRTIENNIDEYLANVNEFIVKNKINSVLDFDAILSELDLLCNINTENYKISVLKSLKHKIINIESIKSIFDDINELLMAYIIDKNEFKKDNLIINNYYDQNEEIKNFLINYKKISSKKLDEIIAFDVKKLQEDLLGILDKLFKTIEEYKERCNRLYLVPNKNILFLLINPFKIEKILYELFEVQEIIFKNNYILGIKEEQEDIFFEKPIDIEENFCKTINLFETTLKEILLNKLTLKIESKKLNENYTNQRLEINFSKTESKLLTKNIYPMHHHLEYYKKNDMIMTPMTKRIFSCFILYFYNDLNGIILYGKSGSGKTETVKYFAKKLGRKIFVYCCDEKTNITILDEIFTKCAKTDSFLCLDEFNRLNAETMSTLHKLISKYKKSCKTKIYLFCTMNLGYKGRFNLPKSLLNIFGSIRVDQPDMKEIAEYYEKENSTLLVKIFEILLLKFCQYDFGIRALKTVLKIYKSIFSILKIKNEKFNIISNYNSKNIRKESLDLIKNYIDECAIKNQENLNDSSIYDKKSFKNINKYYLMLSILLYTCPMLISNEKQYLNEIISKFFNEKIPSIDFKNFCLYNKRGIILVGKCNTGKSSFIIKKFKEKNYIVILTQQTYLNLKNLQIL